MMTIRQLEVPDLRSVAREGALHKLSPALCAGFGEAVEFAAFAATNFARVRSTEVRRFISSHTRNPVDIDTKFAVKMVSMYTGC
jgi:hypothetical protein